jgi:hypothetical protein
MQIPRYQGLEELVFQTFNRMYEVFEQQRALIPRERLCEVRYEDLVKEPLEQMRAIYEQLELGGFEEVLPAFQRYFADKADYQTNRFELSPQERAEIGRRWRSYIERYGYEEQPSPLPLGGG